MGEFKETRMEKVNIFDYIKSIIIAIIFSLLSILLFAFLIKTFEIADSAIKPVNYVIKFLSIFLGTLILVRGKSGGFSKGATLGGIYIILAYILFSILNGVFNFTLSLLFDLFFGIIIGSICGIICVNFKRK